MLTRNMVFDRLIETAEMPVLCDDWRARVRAASGIKIVDNYEAVIALQALLDVLPDEGSALVESVIDYLLPCEVEPEATNIIRFRPRC